MYGGARSRSASRAARLCLRVCAVAIGALAVSAQPASADRISAYRTDGRTCHLDSYIRWEANLASPIFWRVVSGVVANCPTPAVSVVGATYLFETDSSGRHMVAQGENLNASPGYGIETYYDLADRSSTYDSTGDLTVHIPAAKTVTWTGSSRPGSCQIYNSGKSIWCYRLNDVLAW